MGPERAFRTQTVLPFLKTLQNCYWMPIQQVAISGDPDYILFFPCQAGGLELKALKGKHEKLQIWKGNQIEEKGGFYIKANPSNWAAVKLQLKQLDRGERI